MAAKKDFVMLVVAAARRRLRGASPIIRERGKVSPRVLRELTVNGYLEKVPGSTGYLVTDNGLRKLDEWRRMEIL